MTLQTSKQDEISTCTTAIPSTVDGMQLVELFIYAPRGSWGFISLRPIFLYNHLFLWPFLCYHKNSEDWKVKNLLVLSKNQITPSLCSAPTAHWYWEKEDERVDHLPQQQPSFKLEYSGHDCSISGHDWVREQLLDP